MMSVIKFTPQESERIEEFLDSVPDIGQMDAETLKQYRERTEQAIRDLDELEPRSQTSEAYERWADLHEDLEDTLDEILDCLEDLGEA
ncbi:MAG: hypothetical protein ACI3XG_04830 [Faecousia sp.]